MAWDVSVAVSVTVSVDACVGRLVVSLLKVQKGTYGIPVLRDRLLVLMVSNCDNTIVFIHWEHSHSMKACHYIADGHCPYPCFLEDPHEVAEKLVEPLPGFQE